MSPRTLFAHFSVRKRPGDMKFIKKIMSLMSLVASFGVEKHGFLLLLVVFCEGNLLVLCPSVPQRHCDQATSKITDTDTAGACNFTLGRAQGWT